MRHTRGRGVFVRQSRQRQVRIPLQDTGKPADVAGFHWRKRRVRKERSDGIAIAALVRQSRQRQVRIPLQDTGKPADVAGFLWRKRRDSNPRGLSPKRFSRPPRYDHFDTLPCATIIARFACGFNNMNIFAPDLFVFRGTEEMHFTLRLLAAVATGCTYATEGRRGRFACPCNNDGRQRRRLRLRAAVRRGGRKVVGGRRYASVMNPREFFAARYTYRVYACASVFSSR